MRAKEIYCASPVLFTNIVHILYVLVLALIQCIMDGAIRLLADPCVSVQDLESALRTFTEVKQSKDLYCLLKHPQDVQVSWKSRPQLEWLVPNCGLISQLVKVAPNAVLHSAKLVSALKALRLEGSVVNKSGKDDASFDDWCDVALRVLLQQFRELKRDEGARLRMKTRCSHKQWVAIEMVLNQISFQGKEKGPRTAKSSECLVLVDKTTTPERLPEEKPFSIFKKNLSENESQIICESSVVPSTPRRTNTADPIKSPRASPKLFAWKMQETPPLSQSSSTDEAMMQKVMSTTPALKTKRKIVEHEPEEDSPSYVAPVLKKPSKKTASQSSKHKSHSGHLDGHSLGKIIRGVKAKASVDNESCVPIDAVELKKQKHRFTSSAYHKAHDAELKESKNKDKAKEVGRAAYKKALLEFNSKHKRDE